MSGGDHLQIALDDELSMPDELMLAKAMNYDVQNLAGHLLPLPAMNSNPFADVGRIVESYCNAIGIWSIAVIIMSLAFMTLAVAALIFVLRFTRRPGWQGPTFRPAANKPPNDATLGVEDLYDKTSKFRTQSEAERYGPKG